MDYETFDNYREEIATIAKDLTDDPDVQMDGDGYISVVTDDLRVHFKIEEHRERDSFRIYEGLLMDEYGGHTDPLIKTDDFDHAKTEWRIYLRQNTENDENGGGEQSGLDSF